MKKRVRGAFAVLALFMGCSDDDGNTGPPGRGTATCHQWQSALCEWIGKCAMPGADACNQIRAIACKSDAEAERCATALRAATCVAPPANCDIRDLADPAPAKKACEELSGVVCAKSEQCQPASGDACFQELENTLPCADFIGVTLAYEQCISEMRNLACTAAGPEACRGVLLR
ncbi:MAG TPA: hypothetical protein VK550_36545 [Polyangiaceae bacterium]|nr:hypothetical protein [Polyangiaceae bacterium]